MAQLRDTLIELQKEKTLRLLLGTNYDTASDQEKEHFYAIVKNQIEVDVDVMIQQYILSYQASSPVVQKNKKIRWVYIVGNVILGTGGAYAVNKEEWIFVGLMGLLMIVNQYLPFVYNKD